MEPFEEYSFVGIVVRVDSRIVETRVLPRHLLRWEPFLWKSLSRYGCLQMRDCEEQLGYKWTPRYTQPDDPRTYCYVNAPNRMTRLVSTNWLPKPGAFYGLPAGEISFEIAIRPTLIELKAWMKSAAQG